MATSRRWWLVAALGTGALAMGTAVAFGATATATPTLRATYDVLEARGANLVVQYTVSNTGTVSVTGWTVQFDLPAGTVVRSAKNAKLTKGPNNHYSVTNKHNNAVIGPGLSTTFDLLLSGTGRPINCLVNGAPCTGSVPSPSPSRSSPSPSKSPSRSPSASPSRSPSASPSRSPSASPSRSPSASPSPSPSTSPSPSKSPSPSVSPSTSPSASKSPSPSPSSTAPGGRTVNVSTAAQLKAALANARPGDTIHLADGSYVGAFYGTVSGTSTAPVTLTGSRNAVLSNPNGACDPNIPAGAPVSYCGYGFHLNRANYWNLVGFSVGSSAKGIVFDSANHSVVDGVQVSRSDLEGIHLRTASSDNVVRNSFIHDTGVTEPGFAEGLYFGSAQSNWDKYGENGGTGPDRSDRNQALTNTFGPNVGGEHIDIKEGTVAGAIVGNHFNGGLSGQHFADSWLDVKGNNYTLTGNVGVYGTNAGVLVDGYQVHQILAPYGCGNVWRSNSSDLGGVGNYAINVTDQSRCSGNPNVVYSSNTVTNAKIGLTNITVTNG
jgi:Cellulose binding domain